MTQTVGNTACIRYIISSKSVTNINKLYILYAYMFYPIRYVV